MELPWFYLGYIATVLYGREGDASTPDLAAERASALQSVRASGPQTSGPHPAIKYVAETVQQAIDGDKRQDGFRWIGWPDIEVKVREFPSTLNLGRRPIELNRWDYILGPYHVVLPWPFAGVGNTPENKALFGVEAFDEDEDFDSTTDVLADPLLEAADFLVKGDDPEGRLKPGENAKRQVLRRVRGASGRRRFTLPRSAQIDPKAIPTEWTRLDLAGEGVRMVLGTVESVSPPSFSDYPCGLYFNC